MADCIHVIVRGEVQGVGYRAFAVSEARRLGLAGWVRNLRDGSVEAVAEGEEGLIYRWLNRLREGPTAARVDELQPVWEEAQGRMGFIARSTAPAAEPFRTKS
jgi:acylphosphatase